MIPLNVSHDSSFSQILVTNIDLGTLPMMELLFNDSSLNLAAVFAGAVSGANFSTSRNFSIQWSAPLHDLSFSSFSVAPYNSTYDTISLPFTFTESSSYLGLNASLDGFITSSSGSQLGIIQSYKIEANPMTTYSGTLQGYVSSSSLTQMPFTFKLFFHTSYGVFEKDVIVNG